MHDYSPEYLSCTDQTNENTCQATINYIRQMGGLQEVVEGSDYDFLTVLFVIFIIALVAVVVCDLVRVYRDYQLTQYMWTLYLENQSQYREIMTIVRGGVEEERQNGREEDGN